MALNSYLQTPSQLIKIQPANSLKLDLDDQVEVDPDDVRRWTQSKASRNYSRGINSNKSARPVNPLLPNIVQGIQLPKLQNLQQAVDSLSTPYGTIHQHSISPQAKKEDHQMYRSKSIDVIQPTKDEKIKQSLQKLESKIKGNMDQIDSYRQGIDHVLTDLDQKLIKVTNTSQKQMAHDFDMWLQIKDREFKDINQQISQKLAVRDANEEIIKNLRRKLQVEEAKRFELDVKKEQQFEELKRMSKICESLKQDCAGYKKTAKEEQQRTINMETELQRMRDQRVIMAKEIAELKTQNRIMMMNNESYQVKQNAVSDIAKFVDPVSIKQGHDGNRFRFMKFLDNLYTTYLGKEDKIKIELIQYFDAVDLAYRAHINGLNDKIASYQRTSKNRSPINEQSTPLAERNSQSPLQIKNSPSGELSPTIFNLDRYKDMVKQIKKEAAAQGSGKPDKLSRKISSKVLTKLMKSGYQLGQSLAALQSAELKESYTPTVSNEINQVEINAYKDSFPKAAVQEGKRMSTIATNKLLKTSKLSLPELEQMIKNSPQHRKRYGSPGFIGTLTKNLTTRNIEPSPFDNTLFYMQKSSVIKIPTPKLAMENSDPFINEPRFKNATPRIVRDQIKLRFMEQ